MTPAEVTVNPIYGRMLAIVNEAMDAADLTRVSACSDVVPPCRLRQALHLRECLPQQYPYQPTWHEVSTFRAIDLAINGQQRQFLEYSSGLSPMLDPVQVTSLDDLMGYACRFPVTLRWAMLLHDIAKDRYPRVQEQEDPNPKKADHPTLCAEAVLRIRDSIVKLSIELGEYCMNTKMHKIIPWLVQNHDILGNMFTAERPPGFLLKPIHKPNDPDYGHRLSLLQVITLCDVWATVDGKALTEQKALYWLSLRDRDEVVKKQEEFYDWRIKRWAGHLDGRDDPEAEAYVKEKLKRTTAKLVFGQYIDYVVYGFYLVTALSKEELVTLLSLIADEYGKRVKDRQCITLVFDKFKPWEPDTAKVLKAYREQIARNKLDCEYDSKTATLRVVALRDQKGSAEPDAPADADKPRR